MVFIPQFILAIAYVYMLLTIPISILRNEDLLQVKMGWYSTVVFTSLLCGVSSQSLRHIASDVEGLICGSQLSAKCNVGEYYKSIKDKLNVAPILVSNKNQKLKKPQEHLLRLVHTSQLLAQIVCMRNQRRSYVMHENLFFKVLENNSISIMMISQKVSVERQY